MKNELNSRWTSRANLFANAAPRQACSVAKLAGQSVSTPSLGKRQKNVWKAPVTAEYLQALREADELVFQAILRGAALRHSARVLKA